MIRYVFCHVRRVGWLLLSLALVTTACVQEARGPTLAPTLTTAPVESPTAPPSGNQPDGVIKLATEALAATLGVDSSAVALVSMERQDFPDAALGCAQPGEVAAAVVTPGYKVVLSADGAQYELHTNLNGTMVRCLPTATPIVALPDVTPSVTSAPIRRPTSSR